MPFDRLEGLRNDMSRKHRDTVRPGSPDQAAGAGPVAPGRGAPCHTPALLPASWDCREPRSWAQEGQRWLGAEGQGLDRRGWG